MRQERYNEAEKINNDIKTVSYEIGVLQAVIPTKIRFGDSFNVSHPITVSEDLFKDIVSRLLGERIFVLNELKENFEKI